MSSARPDNCGTLLGRIATKDIKLISNGNNNVCRINVAIDRFVPKDKLNDPNVKKVDFIPLVLFGDDAKNMSQWGKAGKWVSIVYHLGQNEWTDKNTQTKRSETEVVVDSWKFMPVVSGTGNKPADGSTPAAANGDQPVAAGAGDEGGFYPISEDDELPF